MSPATKSSGGGGHLLNRKIGVAIKLHISFVECPGFNLRTCQSMDLSICESDRK